MTTKRKSKTAAQQSRHYEVDNIFEYMVETYLNGNFSTFRELYAELNKEANYQMMPMKETDANYSMLTFM